MISLFSHNGRNLLKEISEEQEIRMTGRYMDYDNEDEARADMNINVPVNDFDDNYMDDTDPLKWASDIDGTYVIIEKCKCGTGEKLLSHKLYTSLKDAVYTMRNLVKNSCERPTAMAEAEIITLETFFNKGDYNYILGHEFGDTCTKYMIVELRS